MVFANQVPQELAYFDGASWFDTLDVLKEQLTPDERADGQDRGVLSHFTLLGTAERGRLLLLMHKSLPAKIVALSFDQDKLTCTPIPAGENAPLFNFSIQSASGQPWFYAMPGAGCVGAYRDGKIVTIACPGVPIWADSAGRLWTLSKQQLGVIVDDRSTSVTVPDLTPDARLYEGPDGRLWLVHQSGIDRVELVNGTPALTHHFALHQPLNVFQGFIDSANGLWLGGGRVGRFQLPQ